MSCLWKLCASTPIFFFVCLVAVPARCSVCRLASNAKSSDSPPPRTFISVSRLTCTLSVWLSQSVYPNFQDHGSLLSSPTLPFCGFTQTGTHSLQLISSSHTCSSGRTWPCLIVHHAYLFSLHDVTPAYLFSPGLLSHIKMIDSFHSLHIFKLYLISSFVLAF